AEAHAAPAALADGVDLVDEDDGRRRGARLIEEVADARGPDADEHLDELRAAGLEEGDLGLAGGRLGEERLAGAGRPDEQHPLRVAPAEGREALRLAQELDDLLQLGDGLVGAADVLEGHLDVLGLYRGRLALADAEDTAGAARGPAQPARGQRVEAEE